MSHGDGRSPGERSGILAALVVFAVLVCGSGFAVGKFDSATLSSMLASGASAIGDATKSDATPEPEAPQSQDTPEDAAPSPDPAVTPAPAPAAEPEPAPGVPLRPILADSCKQYLAKEWQEWCNPAYRVNYASVIVDVGRREAGVSRRAWIVAVATAMQESSLYNQANNKVPESKKYPHDKVGDDHDSIGLFQQRPNWGPPDELMNPRISARKFYDALKMKVINPAKVKGQNWEKMRLWEAAQAVQRSGHPEEYAKREAPATALVDFVLRYPYDPEQGAEGAQHASSSGNGGFVMMLCGNKRAPECRSERWQLIQPIIDNKKAFREYFPKGTYSGDNGDFRHMREDTQENKLQDHAPMGKYREACVGSHCNIHGFIYAQDFGHGGGFNLVEFVPWLVDEISKGKYEEVKYIICSHPGLPKRYNGYMDVRHGWKQGRIPRPQYDHRGHVHISYKPGYEAHTSTILQGFAKHKGVV